MKVHHKLKMSRTRVLIEGLLLNHFSAMPYL